MKILINNNTHKCDRVLLIIPAVFILFLWTLISTPTAKLEKVNGEKHLICDTGGFTGPPGGYIFFAIFVFYTALIALFGAFLSVVTRKVPTLFNESKLVAISIYNLFFVAIIIIPWLVFDFFLCFFFIIYNYLLFINDGYL
jgi:hypothetical protein